MADSHDVEAMKILHQADFTGDTAAQLLRGVRERFNTERGTKFDVGASEEQTRINKLEDQAALRRLALKQALHAMDLRVKSLLAFTRADQTVVHLRTLTQLDDESSTKYKEWYKIAKKMKFPSQSSELFSPDVKRLLKKHFGELPDTQKDKMADFDQSFDAMYDGKTAGLQYNPNDEIENTELNLKALLGKHFQAADMYWAKYNTFRENPCHDSVGREFLPPVVSRDEKERRKEARAKRAGKKL
jgi:hypothetical protein